MARGNQREKAREANQKKMAQMVSHARLSRDEARQPPRRPTSDLYVEEPDPAGHTGVAQAGAIGQPSNALRPRQKYSRQAGRISD
jgi:hypothetical protein